MNDQAAASKRPAGTDGMGRTPQGGRATQDPEIGATSPRPYYEDDVVTLYLGDAREMNWPVSCENVAVITDPPYGTSLYESDKIVLDGAMLSTWVLDEAQVAVFGWPEDLVSLCLDAALRPTEWVTWWPTNSRQGGGFVRSGLWRETECIAVFGASDWGRLRQPHALTTTPMPNPGVRGQPHPDGARMGDVWREPKPNLNPNQPDRLHPNEKPIEVLRRLVTALSDRGDVIYDPFAGSGTTLVAAKQEGRLAVGVEIEERYCEVAARRLSQEVLDLAV